MRLIVMHCALNAYVDIGSTRHSGSWCTELTSSAFINEFFFGSIKYTFGTSSSDTDEDLNVSQYDVEDDLNAYGSPVYSTQVAADAISLPATSHTRTQASKYFNRLFLYIFVFGFIFWIRFARLVL